MNCEDTHIGLTGRQVWHGTLLFLLSVTVKKYTLWVLEVISVSGLARGKEKDTIIIKTQKNS